MTVEVEYMAQLRVATGCRSDRLEIAAGSTLAELLAVAADRYDESAASHFVRDGKPSPSLLCAVRGAQASWDYKLQDGDRVTLLTPISGG